MSDLTLRLSFRGGWCDLAVASGEAVVESRTHWLSDGFIEFLHAVDSLLAGRRSASTRWAREIGGGHFVDLVLDPEGGVGLAVHELVESPAATRVAEVWSAERGSCVFRAHTTLDHLVRQVVANLHRLRLRDVDPTTGMISGWPRTFPSSMHERLEQEAVNRFGYRPLSRVELDHEDPA